MVLLIFTLIAVVILILVLKTGTAALGGILVEREKQPFAFGLACLIIVLIGAGGIVGALADILHR